MQNIIGNVVNDNERPFLTVRNGLSILGLFHFRELFFRKGDVVQR